MSRGDLAAPAFSGGGGAMAAALPSPDAVGGGTPAGRILRSGDLHELGGHEVDQAAAGRAAPVLLPFAGAIHLGPDRRLRCPLRGRRSLRRALAVMGTAGGARAVSAVGPRVGRPRHHLPRQQRAHRARSAAVLRARSARRPSARPHDVVLAGSERRPRELAARGGGTRAVQADRSGHRGRQPRPARAQGGRVRKRAGGASGRGGPDGRAAGLGR